MLITAALVCMYLLSMLQLAGVVANSAAANGMEVDGQQQQQQGRKLYFGSQELGYKRPDMEVSKTQCNIYTKICNSHICNVQPRETCKVQQHELGTADATQEAG
jgi:hypothetical protein